MCVCVFVCACVCVRVHACVGMHACVRAFVFFFWGGGVLVCSLQLLGTGSVLADNRLHLTQNLDLFKSITQLKVCQTHIVVYAPAH